MTESEYNSVRKTCKHHIMQNGGLHCDHLYNHATICEVDVCPLMKAALMRGLSKPCATPHNNNNEEVTEDEIPDRL